jgi:hypothetical protein
VQAQRKRVGLLLLGRLAGTLHNAPSLRADARSWVRAMPTQALGAPAQAPEKSTGEQPVTSGLQLSYAEATKPTGTLKPKAKGQALPQYPLPRRMQHLGARLPDPLVACPGL